VKIKFVIPTCDADQKTENRGQKLAPCLDTGTEKTVIPRILRNSVEKNTVKKKAVIPRN
jgi:hypothetical protein